MHCQIPSTAKEKQITPNMCTTKCQVVMWENKNRLDEITGNFCYFDTSFCNKVILKGQKIINPIFSIINKEMMPDLTKSMYKHSRALATMFSQPFTYTGVVDHNHSSQPYLFGILLLSKEWALNPQAEEPLYCTTPRNDFPRWPTWVEEGQRPDQGWINMSRQKGHNVMFRETNYLVQLNVWE